ncbi:hypothetical protein [Tunicatimonas pelagia]|uniref:hypothetical protein n=1 Tax=Tunicatimonas pelagia TaxID=931531 RepID=UPI0026663BC7|nr:hypothetical protein [Tunicatimonas pelagia]WKN46203.1 hypothetical protein P0M28_14720 [Tunicatimonas pelagia]
MRTIVTIFALIVALSEPSHAQEESPKYSNDNVWNTLSKVIYRSTEDEFGMINLPIFSSEIEEMEGTEITVPGYIIPAGGLDAVFEPDHFVLSSLPLAACFFCGMGGPETVVEVYLKEPMKYTDTPIKIKGTLTLNTHDTYQLMYILEDATLVGEVN